jgi:hypothetical protein
MRKSNPPSIILLFVTKHPIADRYLLREPARAFLDPLESVR